MIIDRIGGNIAEFLAGLFDEFARFLGKMAGLDLFLNAQDSICIEEIYLPQLNSNKVCLILKRRISI